MPKQRDGRGKASVDPRAELRGKWAVDGGDAVRFEGYEGTLEVFDIEDVLPAIERVEVAVRRDQLHAVGFVSYEAAPGFDAALSTLPPPSGLPLMWFAFFRRRVAGGISAAQEKAAISWSATMTRQMYEGALERIAEYIVAGDTYQVNFTMKMKASLGDSPHGLYEGMCRAQGDGYFARIDTGTHLILSASPELFFHLEDSQLTTRPMKGTRPRGRWLAEDEELERELASSAKDRAENVMITDLLRNDMGRISVPGSVWVPALWEVERYETVWQMTSTIQSRLQDGASLGDLFTALFPCGSVTGAPKIRTMQILTELETEPRGIYTGSIGFLSPDENASSGASGPLAGIKATFSVAIRTISIDRSAGLAEFGAGSGVTHGSTPKAEYEECLLKTQVLTRHQPEFSLLETVLFEPGEGYFLLSRHLERLHESARYFGFSCDIGQVTVDLESHATGFSKSSAAFRVRLTLSRSGGIEVTAQPVETMADDTMMVNLEPEPVDSSNPFLYHKTTNRQIYDVRRSRHPQSDDIVLQNERGELTECSIGNLVIRRGGRYLTPAAESGLLKGTFRAELLELEQIEEAVLFACDLEGAEELFMINSVRRWVRLELAERSTMAV
jgi:para-aminobenzoate synthetase/4-amino-4-deoxychorismate lyase